jgi:hypothetical protein
MDTTKPAPAESGAAKLRHWTTRLFHLGGVAAILWAAAIWITVDALKSEIPPIRAATPGDFEALLFGASSVALVIFSVVIGVIAFLGYDHLKRDTASEVQTATRERIDKLEKELRGRVSSSIGLMLGVTHATPEEQEEEERLDYLAESVKHSELAYASLKEVGVKAQYTALNNIVYYSCALGRVYNKESLLQRAEELRQFSQENRPDPFLEGLITYCRAVSDLSEDPAQVERAYRIGTGLLTELLNNRQRIEATMYVASLRKKREQGKTNAESRV